MNTFETQSARELHLQTVELAPKRVQPHPMKEFRFQQFCLQQNEKVFRVGTDGVLLGAMCNVKEATRVLEVGTGTGLISLMMAQRNPKAKIVAIDVDPEAVALAQVNVERAPFAHIQVEKQDYTGYAPKAKFDLIVSNPPYFEVNPSSKDRLARQQVSLSYADLIQQSAQNLTPGGVFSVIIPSAHFESFVDGATKNNFHLGRKVNVFGIKEGGIKRVLLEFSLLKGGFIEENFIIEKAPRQYSEQYLNLTKDFHVFLGR